MASKTLNVGGRQVGDGSPTFIIAEVAQAHDGSLGTAHAYIDAAASAGADAVKFQTHIAAAESTPGEPWRVKFSPQDATRYDYWQRMEFTEAQWAGLKQHADERGLVFLSSPFSPEAVALLRRVGVPAWKVASGEVNNAPLLRGMAATGEPVLISSGMSSYAELDAAVRVVREAGAPVGVFQCTSAYPCPPSQVGLNVVTALRARYNVPVGLSDHSGVGAASVAAVALGANMIEVHVTLSRAAFGPDVPASLTVEELAEMVRGVRFVGEALANPVDKDAAAAEMEPLRKLFNKSIVMAADAPRGTVLRAAHLALKKPGSGIPAGEWANVLGRTLARDVAANTLLQPQDFEDNPHGEA